MNQKGFAPIFIVLVIVLVISLIGGSYYLGTQTNDKATNSVEENEILPSLKPNESTVSSKVEEDKEWIDFVSTTKGLKLGAIFKYPKGWEISEFGEGNQEGSAYIISIQNYEVGKCELHDNCQIIGFHLSSPADGVSQDYQEVSKISIGEKLVKHETEVGSETYTRKQDVMVDNINSYQYLVERTGIYVPKMTYYVLTKKGEKYYYISSSNESLLQKFITTIKFTE